MKVLLADKFEAAGLEALEELGCTVESKPTLTADALPAALEALEPDVLIVRSTRVGKESVGASQRLSLIVRAGAGYDTIAVDEASKHGIFVANCPGKNASAVAELTWALILSCDRRVPVQTAELLCGAWNKKEFSKARGLRGRTLGILGLGTIGREVAAIARAFGMEVIAWSRSLTSQRADELGIQEARSPIELAGWSDVVSVHVAATPQTEGLIDEAFVGAMREGAILINTSRGSVLDEAAVLQGVRDKGIRVGLDVYKDEPAGSKGEFNSVLIGEPGVCGTHHVGASTDQAQHAIALEAVRIIGSYMATGEVPNCVNRADRSAATSMLTVRHRNRPGVLAGVFRVLSEASINVEEMENLIYEGGDAACARIRLARAASAEQIELIRGSSQDLLGVQQNVLGR